MSINIHNIKEVIKNNWPLIVILFLALALRLAYFFILHPPLTWSDAGHYDMMAWNLVQGNGYSIDGINPTPFVEPGYALFFLAPFYLIFGHNIVPPQIFQTLLSIGSIFLIYLIGYKFFNKKIGLLASFIWTIWPAEIAFSQEILTDIPFTFLLLSSVYLLLLSIKNNSRKILWIAGLVFGITTITRFLPFFLPIFLIPAFYLIFKYHSLSHKIPWRQALLYSCVMLLGIMIFFAPWTIRNYMHFQKFYFGRQGVGAGVWAGSYLPSKGLWTGDIPSTEGEKIPFTEDKSFIKYTLKYIKNNPYDIIKIYSKKPYKIFLKSVTYGQAAHHPGLAKFLSISPVIDILIRRGLQFTHLTVMLFGFIGLLYLFRKKEMFISLIFATLIIYFIAIYLPFPPDARYQIPLMPYIIILASVGFWFLFDKIAEWRENIPRNSAL